MRIIYIMKEFITGKVPYFDKHKYIKDMTQFEEFKEEILIEMLNSTSQWYDIKHNERLFQTGKRVFLFDKKNKDYRSSPAWVSYRNKKGEKK